MNHLNVFRAASAFLLAAIAAPALSLDLHVPMPYITVQQAINAAQDGDTVMLQPGVYNENINVNGKDITIKAFNTSFESIIDGRGLGSVVTFSGGESSNCVLRNLTLRNGFAALGGGIQGNYTLATVKNCKIIGNTATTGGGVAGMTGVFQSNTVTFNVAGTGAGIANCEGMILNNTISSNIATENGGAIAGCEGNIYSNVIKNNSAEVRGGAIYSCDGVISGNIISGNTVTTVGSQQSPGSFGGAISNCSGFIEINDIFSNSSNGLGGAMDACSGIIRNNFIRQNSARNGGALSNCTGRVEHNTLFGNAATFTGGGMLNCSSPVNCILWNNFASSDTQLSGANGPISSCVEGWIGQPDIVNADPQFVDRNNGNLHLLGTSPCIDAGTSISDTLLDLDGDFRGTIGTLIAQGDGSRYDIGADEFLPPNVDLTGFWTSCTSKYKGKAPKRQCSLKGSLTVQNTGNISSAVPCSVRYYLSADPFLDGSDLPIGLPVNLTALSPGKTKKLKLNVKLPVGTTVTGMYVIAYIDWTGIIVERNEFNNGPVSVTLL